MPNIKIDPAILKVCPNIQLGILNFEVKVAATESLLLKDIENEIDHLSTSMEISDIKKMPVIEATRNGYKAIGKDPSRYRPSAESLLRRVLQGKGLYQVNNIVDTLNLISIKTGFSIGGYDLDKINGSITMTIGQRDEPYQGIGRGQLNIEFMPVLKDEIGAFGSPTSDSVRTSVTTTTRRFMMVFFNFDGAPKMKSALELAEQLYTV